VARPRPTTKPWLPERVEEWRTKRWLKGVLREIEARYRPRMKAAKGEHEEEGIHLEWSEEDHEFSSELEFLESRRVLRRAYKWEIDVPTGDGMWTSDQYDNTRYLTFHAQRKLRRAIRDARRESVKWWMQLILPILSLLVALVGAMIGLLSYLNGMP
jgi:hypothetical protein